MSKLESKIERARQHLAELEGELIEYIKSRPYTVSTKRDSDRKLIYFISDVKEIPQSIALITGDILQNLRSSLDHLAYGLFVKNTTDGTSGRHIYFPISHDLEGYETEKVAKTRGMSQGAKNLIDAYKPYKDGNINLWQINKLNNIDKHRLIITVGASFGSMDIGAHVSEMFKKNFPQSDGKFPPLPIFIKPADPLFPLKIGDQLFVDGPDAKEIPHMQFKFEILINEPGIIEGEPLVEFLKNMTVTVEEIFMKFKSAGFM